MRNPNIVRNRTIVRNRNIVLALTLVAILGLGGCVPDVVGIEAVPTSKLPRDLAQCNAENTDVLGLGHSVKRCMKAKGHRFLRQY